MKSVKVQGYSALYVEKYDCYIILTERVRVYDGEFKISKRFPEIKHPDTIRLSKDEEYAYVTTTENYLYRIDMSNLKVEYVTRIIPTNLSAEESENASVFDFLILDRAHLLCLQFSVGCHFIIYFDITNDHCEVIREGSCESNFQNLIELDDWIAVVDEENDWANENEPDHVKKELIPLNGLSKKIYKVQFYMEDVKPWFKVFFTKFKELKCLVPEINMCILYDGRHLYFVDLETGTKVIKIDVVIRVIWTIENAWYDADDSLLYLIVNRHSFGSGIIVMSLKDIDNPKIAYVVRGYSDCIRCRDGLLFLSYDRELKSFMVNNIEQLSSYAIPPSTQEVRL